jgi:hypothetical protein
LSSEATADCVSQVKGWEDFRSCQNFSTDGSAQQGGDLGWFGKTKWLLPLKGVAFSLELARPATRSVIFWVYYRVLGHTKCVIWIAPLSAYVKRSSTYGWKSNLQIDINENG